MIDAAIQKQLEHLATVYPEGHVPVESLAACQAELDEAKERIDTLTGFVYSAEAELNKAKRLVTQAYDEWGGAGHPTNTWRKRAEDIGCWPPRTNA